MEDSGALSSVLAVSAAQHSHLCPRQVLGARAALAGAAWLGLDLPRADKRLLVILETDGCFADGIQAAAGVSVGHRTLRIEDYGKLAATFVDVMTETALRVVPRADIRRQAHAYAPHEPRRYFAQLTGYQVMPATELLVCQPVRLSCPVSEIISCPGALIVCSQCGEEIINEREIIRDGHPLCRSCAGESYYHPVDLPPRAAYRTGDPPFP